MQVKYFLVIIPKAELDEHGCLYDVEINIIHTKTLREAKDMFKLAVKEQRFPPNAFLLHPPLAKK